MLRRMIPWSLRKEKWALNLGRPLVRLATTDFHSGLADSVWALYGLVRSMKPQVCVEIGSARGNSACHIGLALKENGGGRLYAIDPHQPTAWNDEDSIDTYAVLRENLRRAGVEQQVEIVRQASTEAASEWDRAIDLLFIDGDHSYGGVRRDWELFSPFVSRFGVVVFHDTIWEVGQVHEESRRDNMGVPRLVDELRLQGYPVITLARDCGVSLVQMPAGGQPLR